MKEITKLDSTTWSIHDQFVEFFLLAGAEKAMVIDSGFSGEDAKEICQGLTDLPLILVNTHGDGDHVAGTAAFDEIHITQEDYENCGLAEKFPNVGFCPIHDGDVFDLGGRTVKVITIPGHTYGSVALLDVEARRLYGGDSVQSDFIFMFGDHRCPDQFAASMEKLCAITSEFDTVIGSHGTLELPGNHVEKVLNTWKKVQNGELASFPMDVHGLQVTAYKTDDCGFFMK